MAEKKVVNLGEPQRGTRALGSVEDLIGEYARKVISATNAAVDRLAQEFRVENGRWPWHMLVESWSGEDDLRLHTQVVIVDLESFEAVAAWKSGNEGKPWYRREVLCT